MAADVGMSRGGLFFLVKNEFRQSEQIWYGAHGGLAIKSIVTDKFGFHKNLSDYANSDRM